MLQQKAKHAEEDFEATIGNLVRYYATLPPGALEASVCEQPEGELEAAAHSTQEVRALPPRRTWAWVMGGAASMILGGVVTFALIVGRPDFWRVADRPAVIPTPQIAVAASAPAKTVRGIPRAVPLADTVEEALSEAAAPAAAAPTANVAAAPAVVEHLAPAAATVKTTAPVRAAAARTTAASAPKRVRARPARQQDDEPQAPREGARPAGDDWEDPYR